MKLLNITTSLISIFGVTFSVIFWYWMAYPYKPLIIEQPLLVMNENRVVQSGDMAYVNAKFKKNTDIIPNISVSIVDGVIYTMPDISPINLKGDYNQIFTFRIPTTLPCGIYHFHFVSKYKMNPVRTVEVRYESEKFEVQSKICYK